MKKTYRVEINPNKEQVVKINQSIGICRFLYNSYIAKNIDLYKQYKDKVIDKKDSFMTAFAFDKYINNELKTKEDFKWINDCGSKARKKSICNAEIAFKRFFKGTELKFLHLNGLKLKNTVISQVIVML